MKKKRILNKSYIFLIPGLIGVLVFYLGPFLFMCVNSFFDNNYSHKSFVGFQNYIDLFSNSAFGTALKNTLLFVCISMPLALIVSLLLALIMEEDIPHKSLYKVLFITPMMVPTASIILVWEILFSYKGAIYQWVYKLFNIEIDFYTSRLSIIMLVILFLWKNLGYFTIIYSAALKEIPTEMIEAARMDGASGFNLLWKIKIPNITPAILFVFIISLMSSFKIFREIQLLVGSYPYDTMYVIQHFFNNTFMSMDNQKLYSSAVLLTIILIVILALLFKLENYFGRDFED